MNISATTINTNDSQRATLSPAKMPGEDSGMMIFQNILIRFAPITFAQRILNSLTCIAPYAVFTNIINEHAYTTIAIFALSPTPKQKRNRGKRAVAGIDLKKSIVGAAMRAASLFLPIKSPRGIPIILEMRNPAAERAIVMVVSLIRSPKKIPSIKLLATDHGEGRNM